MGMLNSHSRLKGSAVAISATVLAFLIGGVVSSAAEARPFKTGVLDPTAFHSHDEVPFERTKALGASFVKANISWPTVAPNPNGNSKPAGFNAKDPADPRYSWDGYDAIVRNARANGLQVIFTVVSTPRWARVGPGCRGSAECVPRASDYADFAFALAKRYSGNFNVGEGRLPRVRYYQAWVEPNLTYFFQPVFKGKRAVAPAHYRRILNAFYDGIHDARQGNRVLSAGLAPLARPGATIGPVEFMRKLFCMKGLANPKPRRGCRAHAKLDIWAVHPYTTGSPTHKAPGADDVSLGDLHKVKRLLLAADRAGKIRKRGGKRQTRMWVTEFSYDSRLPDPGGLPTWLHTRWSTEAMYRMYQAGVDVMIWFGYRDEDPAGRPHCEVFDSGLYRRGANFKRDRAKRFARSFKFPVVATRNRRGFKVWGRTPDSRPGTVRIQLRNRGGGFRSVKRVRARAGGVFQTNVRVRDLAGNATVRARAPRGGGLSVPFSLRIVRDFHQPPFGKCQGGGSGRPS